MLLIRAFMLFSLSTFLPQSTLAFPARFSKSFLMGRTSDSESGLTTDYTREEVRNPKSEIRSKFESSEFEEMEKPRRSATCRNGNQPQRREEHRVRTGTSSRFSHRSAPTVGVATGNRSRKCEEFSAANSVLFAPLWLIPNSAGC